MGQRCKPAFASGGVWRSLAVFGGIWRSLAEFGGVWRSLGQKKGGAIQKPRRPWRLDERARLTAAAPNTLQHPERERSHTQVDKGLI